MGLLFIFWGVYSYYFYHFYNDTKDFATEGAQPIIQILEMLNYRGDGLKLYFILFFILVSLSFLLEIYLYLFIRKYQLSSYPIVILSIMIGLFISFNVFNKLWILSISLVGISLLIMISIVLTVKNLYMNVEANEAGDILRTNGPFKTQVAAENSVEKEVRKFRKMNRNKLLDVNSQIYLEESMYYVDIYLEEINTKTQDDGESNENYE
jgi:uncharacterized protein YacL